MTGTFVDVLKLVGIDGMVKSLAFLDANSHLYENGWNCLVEAARASDLESICFRDFDEPFYFCMTNGRMTVGRSLKAISEWRRKVELPVEMDEEACWAYRDAGLVLPPFTILRDIFQVPLFSVLRRDTAQFFLEFAGIIPAATSKPFENDDAIFDELQHLITERLKDSNDANVVCTLSGGADSAALLSVLRLVVSPSRIHSLTCRMPGFEGEVDRAKRISRKCDVANQVYQPGGISPEAVLDEFIDRYGNVVYDPVVPVLTSMFRAYRGNVNSDRSDVFVVEGQGADTMLGGLPHNAAIALYSQSAAPLFRLLKTILPEPSESLRYKSRRAYRIVKIIRLLAEPDWKRALLRSLDFEPAHCPGYYAKLLSILKSLEQASGDRQKTIMMFFLLILQSREMQKYQLLPEGFKMVMPFMDGRFIERCYLTPTKLFMRLGKRKIPIIKRVRRLFPDLFRSGRTTPFAVQYQIKSPVRGRQGLANAGSYAQMKEYCIDALCSTLRLQTGNSVWK